MGQHPRKSPTVTNDRRYLKKTGTAVRAERLNKVSRLYLRCVPPARIAELCDVSITTIHSDINKLLKIWEDETREKVSAIRGRELRRLDAVEHEFWRAWERSKGTGAKGAGNGEFLRGILDCVRERAKLIGLYAPKEIDATLTFKPDLSWRNRIDELAQKDPRELAAIHQQAAENPRALLTE